MPRRGKNNNNDDWNQDNSNQGGWFSVPGKAEKDVARQERKQRRKEERQQELQEEKQRQYAEDYYEGDVSSYYTSYQAPKVQEEAALSTADRIRNARLHQEDINDYTHAVQEYQSAALSNNDRRQLEKAKQREEQERARKKKEADAAAQRRRQLAQERAARERDPNFWPSLQQSLTENAEELASKLDALHYDDELTSSSSHLRLHYAISIIHELMNNGRVKIQSSSTNDEQQQQQQDVSESLSQFINEELEELKNKNEKVEEALDAIDAHGRATKNLIEVLSAFDAAKVFVATSDSDNNKNTNPHLFPSSSNVGLFVAKMILRGSADWTLENLDVALTHFTPKLLSKNAKESAHAMASLRFVWKSLVFDSNDNKDINNTGNDDDRKMFVAQLCAGVVRTMNTVQKLQLAGETMIIRQVLWLSTIVSDLVCQMKFGGTATHSSVKSVLLLPDTPVSLVSSSFVVTMPTVAQKLLIVLRLVGPRHHSNFTKMTLPVMIKKLSSSSIISSNVNAIEDEKEKEYQIKVEESAIRTCASLLVATSELAQIVPQAAPGKERLIGISTSPLLVKIVQSIVTSCKYSIDDQFARDLRAACANQNPQQARDSSSALLLDVMKKLKTTSASSSASKQQQQNQSSNSTTTTNNNELPQILPTSSEKESADRSSLFTVLMMLMITGFCLWFVSLILRTPQTVDKSLKMLTEWMKDLHLEETFLEPIVAPLMKAYFENFEKN